MDIRKKFARARKAAGLGECIWFHDQKRSFITNARRCGVDETTIMSMSGHRTRSAFERYNIVSAKDQERAVVAMFLQDYTDPYTFLHDFWTPRFSRYGRVYSKAERMEIMTPIDQRPGIEKILRQLSLPTELPRAKQCRAPSGKMRLEETDHLSLDLEDLDGIDDPSVYAE